MPDISPSEFPVDVVWDALQALLKAQLTGVDVAAAGGKDFDDNDNLIITPPAVRGVYMGETAEVKDNQSMSYDVDQNYAILCIAEDLGSDNQQQRRTSTQLAAQVKHILVGARLLIAAAGDDSAAITTEPVKYLGMEPMEVANLGMGYALAFAVPGLALFAAPNA